MKFKIGDRVRTKDSSSLTGTVELADLAYGFRQTPGGYAPIAAGISICWDSLGGPSCFLHEDDVVAMSAETSGEKL